MFLPISQNVENRELGYGNGRNSKTIHPIYMIFGRHMQKTNIYKTMKSFF